MVKKEKNIEEEIALAQLELTWAKVSFYNELATAVKSFNVGELLAKKNAKEDEKTGDEEIGEDVLGIVQRVAKRYGFENE